MSDQEDLDDDSLELEDLYKQHNLNVAPFSKFRFQEGRRPSKVYGFFCDWYPELFGIDEDEIPESEDEEGLFDIDWNELQEKAFALTESELDRMRVGSWECLTDEELRKAWVTAQQPKYGRRARPKPILYRENNEPFECICDIDLHFSRHHIPKFGGGVLKEGEELRVPNFKAFCESLKEAKEMQDGRLSDIFNPKEPQEEKEQSQKPVFFFKNVKKCNLHKFRKKLKKTFRPLDCREVRRHRMPYSEALYLELQEDGFLNGAAFLKYLIVKDYHLHDAADNSGLRLRSKKALLNQIFQVLKLAEKFSRREEYHKETVVYLRAGKYFNDDENWLWLSEEFYKKAVTISKKCVIDGGKSEAIANYVLGKFLLDYGHWVQGAQEHLLRARELSIGKDWNTRNIFQTHQDTVHKESALHLCRALILASKELRENGKPEEALPLIHRSYKLGQELDSLDSDIEMETYFELGMCYQALGMIDWAKTAFNKFIAYASMKNYVEGICDGYLEMAICSRKEGDMERCERSITSYLTAATLRKNENLMAFGNRYLGEFHLHNGDSKTAAQYFNKAFSSFLEQFTKCSEIPFSEWKPEHFTLHQDVELTRILLGLAEGQLITKSVCTLILQSQESESTKAMLKLIEWKNTGEKQRMDDRKPKLVKKDDDYSKIMRLPEEEKDDVSPPTNRGRRRLTIVDTKHDEDLE